MPTPSPDAATRILATAEELFAAHGYSAVSLRQITTAAGVNLAAVNYHYYDKESLYREIVVRRLRQINTERLALLTAAETKAAPHAVPLAELADALARPVFLPSAGGEAGVRVLGRLLIEGPAAADELVETEFQPVMARFAQAIRRSLPTLPAGDFLWRFSFVVGALHHALVTLPNMKNLTQGICHGEDPASALRNFITFVTNALSAK